MKKSLLFIMIMLLVVLFCWFAVAENKPDFFVSGDWKCILLEDNTVKIAEYRMSSFEKNVIIPETIDGRPVSVIGDGAFYSYDYIKNIVIPDGILSIENYAFLGCSSLETITIPDSVVTIGEEAFESCRSLLEIEIPEYVTKIEKGTFAGCKSLKSVKLPAGLLSIDDNAFENCASLTSIELPKALQSIGDNVFVSSLLSELLIPENVSYIGSCTFNGCDTLTNIWVDPSNSSYTSIDGVLYDKQNKSLICYPSGKKYELFEVPEEVQRIYNNAFYRNTFLKAVVIPEGVVDIAKDAFCLCTALQTVVVSHDSLAEKYFIAKDIHCFYQDSLIENRDYINGIIGSWQFLGVMINDVIYYLPDYYQQNSISLNDCGIVFACLDGTDDTGYCEIQDEKLILNFQRNGKIPCTISDNKLFLQYNGVETVFKNDEEPNLVIPEIIAAEDDRQFNGEWRISKVVSQNCRLSLYELCSSGITNLFHISITDDNAEIRLSEDDDSVIYSKMLSEGACSLSNRYLGTNILLNMTETGELLFSILKDGSIVDIYFTNLSADVGQQFIPSEVTGNQVYYIKEKDITISVPPEITCVTRSSDASNIFYHKGFGDYNDVQSVMKNQDILLYGMSNERRDELMLQILDYSDIDFNTTDDSLLNKYIDKLYYSFGYWTAKNRKDDIYHGKTNKAIRLRCKLETLFAGDQYLILYCAVQGSNLIKLQFLSYGDEIAPEQEAMMQEIFDSIEWNETKEPSVISDQELGITYKIPSYWIREKASAGETEWSMRYRIGADNAWISLGRLDLWEKYYENNSETADIYGVTRWNYFDFKRLEAIAAQQLGCADNMIRGGVISNNTYLYNDEQFRSHDRDQEKTYLHFSNGYVYKFCLNGKDAYYYMDQLKKFLSSIEYSEMPEVNDDDGKKTELGIIEAKPFELSSGIYHVGNDIVPGVYYVQQVIPSDSDTSSLYLYSTMPSDENNHVFLSKYFQLGEEQEKIALIEKDEYVEIRGGDLTFCLSPIPDDYYQYEIPEYEIPEGTFLPIGYYTVGEDIPVGLYRVFSGSINGGWISVFPEGTEPDDSGMYIHAVTSQETVAVNAGNKDGDTIILREGKVVCVDLEVVLQKMRDLTDEEKIEEPPEWVW